jgi:hypothetical protein
LSRIDDCSDSRLLAGCLYCLAPAELSKEHSPSRILLEKPLPDHPPVLFACVSCNRSYSLDEEYLAALLGCVHSGSADPVQQNSARVRAILEHSPALTARIAASAKEAEGRISFVPEAARVTRVLHKLAIGHAAFELSVRVTGEPNSSWWAPLSTLDASQRDSFEDLDVIELWGEVGSRGMQRAIVIQPSHGDGMLFNEWVTVQDDVYRYIVAENDSSVRVRIVLREYLAFEGLWLKQ